MRASVVGAIASIGIVVAAPAQGARFGVAGGVALGNPGYEFNGPPGHMVPSGWGLGFTWGPIGPGETFALRLDAGISALNGAKYAANNPNCPVNAPCVQPVYSTDYDMLSATANFAWNVIGTKHRVAPYLIAGAGWYGIEANTQIQSSTGPARMSMAGSLGYSAGLGAQISNWFVEARLAKIDRVFTPFGQQPLYSVPIAVGISF